MVIDDINVGQWALGLIFAVFIAFWFGFAMGKWGGRI